MIHVLFGLYYVFLTVLLLLGYCLVLPAIFWLLHWFWRIGRLVCTPMRWRFWRKDIGLPINRARLRFIGKVALFLLAFSLCLYAKEWIKWTGEGTAHHEAKAYFAAGQPLYGARIALVSLFRPMYRPLAPFHPESRLLAPMQHLQEHIYEQAVRHLPEADAERAAWFNDWFLYPYTRAGLKPRGTYDTEPAPPTMIALLDKAWSCLEALGTLPMADGEVFFAKYLRTYPILAHYYSQGKAYYNERAYDSERDTAKSERHAHRARRLVSWLEKLKLEWAENPEMQAFLREHPDPSPLRDVVALEELAVLIRGDIWRGEFACDSDTVRLYIETRNRFISAKEYRRTADNRNAEALYDFAVNTYKARATRYLLQEYCGVHVAGEEDLDSTF